LSYPRDFSTSEPLLGTISQPESDHAPSRLLANTVQTDMNGVAPFFHLRIDGCATIERTRNNFRRLVRYLVNDMLATRLYPVAPGSTDIVDYGLA
jgi:hypothetical protein